MTHLIDKDALVAEIEKFEKEASEKLTRPVERSMRRVIKDKTIVGLCRKILDVIDTLEVKEVDLELITGWFDHITQIADDRKTLNGVIMEDWAALDEIKCLARNSSEFIQKYYKAQEGE